MDVLGVLGGYGGYLLCVLLGFFFGYKIRDKQVQQARQEMPRRPTVLRPDTEHPGQYSMPDGQYVNVEKFVRQPNGPR